MGNPWQGFFLTLNPTNTLGYLALTFIEKIKAK